MRFAAAQFLWLLLALPLLGLLGGWGSARSRKNLRTFAGGPGFVGRFAGEISLNRRAAKQILLGLTYLSLVLALARPQWGVRTESVTRHGADVVLVLDTSLSMAAEDVAPNRLMLARHALSTLLDRIPSDRVALVTFAGEAHLSCPLTVDHGALRLFLDAVDVAAVPVPGTALRDALALALRSLRNERDELDPRGRVVLLFTDGEDHEGGLEEILPDFARDGVAIHAVGCGTARGGPIPIRDATGQISEYKKDREGKVVTSRLDEALLERIALETGGRYHRATTNEVELDDVARALEDLAAGEIGSQVRTGYVDRFDVPLLVGLAALLVETVLSDRRRAGSRAAPGEREAA